MRLNDKSERRSRSRLLPVLALACAFIAAALVVAIGKPEQPTRSPLEPVFDEAELERYRVDIHPDTPDSGIETGLVFAHGYYVVPPYRVVAGSEGVYVNNVRVTPPLGPAPRSVDSAMLQAYKQSRAGRALTCLAIVAGNGVEFYERMLAGGADTTRALAAAESLMQTDTLVRNVTVSPVNRFRRTLHGPVVARPGGRQEEVKYGMLFPRARPARRVSQLTLDSLFRERAASLEHYLEDGAGCVFAGGVEHSASESLARRLAAVMLEPSLVDGERWKHLSEFISATEAYFCVANLEYSRPTWQALAARLGSGK